MSHGEDQDQVRRALVVHHTVSISTQQVYESALAGLQIDELADLELSSLPALTAGAHDTLRADGVLLLCPVNIGYLAGAMKHYFDQIYYPCLETTKSLPYAAVLHSNSDAAGALRALEAITSGLQWRAVADPLVVAGDPDAGMREQIGELASTLGAYAAGMM